MPDFESQTIQERLIQEVKEMVESGNPEGLKRLVDEMRPADLADLIEHLDPDERLYIFKVLEPEGAGEVLVEMELPAQERLLMDLDNQAISQIVQELHSDDAADLLGDLPAERAKEIIQHLGDEVSREMEKLLPYREDTAGGLMGLEYVAVRSDASVGDAIEIVRQKRDEVESLYYIWVVDGFGRLVGVISLKDLLLEPKARVIGEIMNPKVIAVDAHTDQEKVAHLVKQYNLVNIPVVDQHQRLVGRITHDDIIDVIEEEADEDITMMAGVIDQEIAEDSALRMSRARLPWLIAGLFGGVLAAVVINQFEGSLEKVLALSFFFPAIMAMGGNTGTQASTVVVRGLATGDIHLVNTGRRLWLEMKVAIVNGIICGVILGLVVGVWLGDLRLGGVVALSLILIVINSGVIGSAVPMTLKRLNIDPAIATGPFVTTSNDILSLLIYLGLVTTFLRLAP